MKMLEKILAHPKLLVLAPVGAALLNVQLALVFLLGLILLDLFYGIRKTFKDEEIPFNPTKRVFWQTLKSDGLRRSWKKATEYGVGILVTACFQAIFFPAFTVTILGGTFTILLFVILVACLIEAYSIFENINKINPDNGIQRIIRFINRYFKVYVTDVINKIKTGK